jgi:hypothetical protein
VRVDNVRPLALSDARQLADTQRIRQRRVMAAVGRIDARKPHCRCGEPVNPDSRRQDFVIRDTSHALRCYSDVVSALSQRIRKVENVALLAADVRWKELGQQKNAHQFFRDGTRESRTVGDIISLI